jgi:hypothetical protein
MKTLTATYTVYSDWDLDELNINLDEIHDWEIKYDTLSIQRIKDGEWEEFDGQTTEEQFKHPSSIDVDGKKIP